MKKPQMTPLEIHFLERAIKETPTLKVGGTVPKSQNKGWKDTPLFNTEVQTKLF